MKSNQSSTGPPKRGQEADVQAGTLERADYAKAIELMDAIITRLELRALYAKRQYEEQSTSTARHLIDEMIDLYCTPAAVSIPEDIGRGVAHSWQRVGTYLRRSMQRATVLD